MPFINAKVSVKLDEKKETALKAALGKAITAIPGKSETYLMVNIEDEQHLWFGGKNDKPAAYMEVKILGHAKPEDFAKMTSALCQVLESQLGIDPACVYVSYYEVENWGWNGRNF